MDLAPRGASEGPQVEANERLSRLGRLLSPREECARSPIECTTLTEGKSRPVSGAFKCASKGKTGDCDERNREQSSRLLFPFSEVVKNRS